ncbi:AMP-binding protein [Bradyrhizobium sp. LMG 9283]|uniref:AMP-binding protein n=1 Tax=Bradyrhizobium sp. LMG 9283 TaxID=592064 RepID=UPI00388EBC6C
MIGQMVSMRARPYSSLTATDVFERGGCAPNSETDLCSNEYANALRAFGVRKSGRIEFPLMWFAFAKRSEVMVPINIRYTFRVIEYVLRNTQAKSAVVDGAAWSVISTIERWPYHLAKERIILIRQPSRGAVTNFDALLNGRDGSSVQEDIRSDDQLNIQNTWRKTRFPEDCMLAPDYWSVFSCQEACWCEQPYFKCRSTQPFFYFDPPVHLLKSCRHGGTLYLGPQLSSMRFVCWVKQHRIEWCQVPEMIARRAEAADEDGAPCLKHILKWGWRPDTVWQFRNRFRVRTDEAYAMTEIGFGTQRPNQPDELADSGSAGIRGPFRALRLVNENGSPTPIGDVGDLWMKGRGILKCYWNGPEPNAASFAGGWLKAANPMRRDDFGEQWPVGRRKAWRAARARTSLQKRRRSSPRLRIWAAVPICDVKRGEEANIHVELTDGIKPDNLVLARVFNACSCALAAFKTPRYAAFTPTIPRANPSNTVLKRELIAVNDPVAACTTARRHAAVKPNVHLNSRTPAAANAMIQRSKVLP